MRDMLYKLLYDNTVANTPLTSLQNMAVALILSIVVYITYKFTFSGVVYSKKFNISLIMLALITTMIMNIIGSSIALSLGMVGALSIVRFRTAIKDPRDTAYIFWIIAIGLGAGSSNYFIISIGSAFIAVASFLLSFGLGNDEKYLLIIRCHIKSVDSVRAQIFDIYRACKLRSETIVEESAEIVYQVKFKNKTDISKYEQLKELNNVTMVNLVAQNGETLG